MTKKLVGFYFVLLTRRLKKCTSAVIGRCSLSVKLDSSGPVVSQVLVVVDTSWVESVLCPQTSFLKSSP